ncbi:MAG: HAMP domain-containing sensor histidine kinase [Pseudomonadota bacterium]|nr:HAMP domain-containing sensor histidine kinase [Pseudomonadota bacterium]
MRNSLTLRLITTSFVWVASALAVAALLLILLFRGYIEKRFEDSLQGNLEELVAASNVTAEGTFQMSWRPTDPRFNRPHSGWYWEIRQSDVIASRSDSLWRDYLPVTEPAEGVIPDLQELTGPEDEPLLALVQKITYPQSKRPLLFMVAGPVSDIEQDVRAFSIQVAITLFVLGLGLLLAVWFQVRFGLRPLQTLKRALADIRQGKTERLPQNFPEEVQPMVSELNALLDHNASLLQRARTHAGNLAHALKNPLTVIRNESRDMEEKKNRIIRQQTDTMAASMDRYLSQARIAGTAGVIGARADVGIIIKDLVFSMEQLYRERQIEIRQTLPADCWFQGEAEDLEEMLGNLIDNACKWAGSRVDITAECTGDRLTIDIEDDGVGIPESLHHEALQRGHRLDEAISGSGLGLDIVRDIAELYRGSLQLQQASLGGVCALLDLPAVSCNQ